MESVCVFDQIGRSTFFVPESCVPGIVMSVSAVLSLIPFIQLCPLTEVVKSELVEKD